MATDNEHAIPACVTDAIREAGHKPDTTMAATVRVWWDWYTAKAGWYDREELVNGRRFKVRRHTLHPARRVCREWASAILDDDGTKVGTDAEAVTDLLEGWVNETRFVPTAQRCLERAFGVGTGALALWFDVQEDGTCDIRARRYDARYPKFNKIQAFRDVGLPTTRDAPQKLGFSSSLDTAYCSSQEVVKWT